MTRVGSAHKTQGGPRSDHEGNQQRENHCRGRADRDRSHVGSHQSANHRHRQNGRNHRECGQDGRIADFIDRFHRNICKRAVPVLRHPFVPDNIFDDDDGVIDENPDGEDQGKQSDPVECVAVQKEDDQGQSQSHRNGYRHDAGFPEAENQPDQNRDRNDGDHHVEQQFV